MGKRLTTKQVAEEYNINVSTLRGWRTKRINGDTRFPRFHKLFTGTVYYVRSEFEDDLKQMELPGQNGFQHPEHRTNKT
jgi:transposase-like protein